MDEPQSPNETLRLATHAYSHLPAWLDLSRPMDERQWAMKQALIPAHPQVRANILGLLASRYPVSATTDAATLDLQSRLLADDLDDLPEHVLREACRQAGRTCKSMPLAAEIMEIAQPLMDKLRDDAKHMRDMVTPDIHRAPLPPKPEYVDPATIGDALKFMHAKFAEADAKEGNASRKVDYTQGPLVPNMPAHADASDELRAFAARRMA